MNKVRVARGEVDIFPSLALTIQSYSSLICMRNAMEKRKSLKFTRKSDSSFNLNFYNKQCNAETAMIRLNRLQSSNKFCTFKREIQTKIKSGKYDRQILLIED
ncbi:hypothetical protein T10_7579 [Trichinella papuae]|uniref:Uncharacterized protein n=1 Tax=Trichinella papuae TaxID=268474 RepID=A0A0V1MK74_9BILA|nr:hypothetical protein T10_7579 [Trichinella papuae]